MPACPHPETHLSAVGKEQFAPIAKVSGCIDDVPDMPCFGRGSAISALRNTYVLVSRKQRIVGGNE